MLDGQLAFERLEWIGDSVLDVLVSRHVALTLPPSAGAADLNAAHSGLVRDSAMMRVAERYELPAVAPALHPRGPADRDVRHRQGDAVEAWIGAAWLHGGWSSAAEAVALLVLPGSDDLLAPAPCPVAASEREGALGWAPRDPRWAGLVVSPLPWRRRLVAAGAAVVELAVGQQLLTAHPTWDEGRLTHRRIALTSSKALLEHAARHLRSSPGFPVSDRLLVCTLGAACLDAGPDSAVTLAGRALA